MAHLREGGDDVDTPSLWSCLGCGLCEDPCPTGVGFAAAHEESRHRWRADGRTGLASGHLDLPPEHDEPGARVALGVLRQLSASLEKPPTPRPGSVGRGTFLLTGPVLDHVDPTIRHHATDLLHDSGLDVVDDAAMRGAADAAGGLFLGAGLAAQERTAAARLRQAWQDAARDGVTVVLADSSLRRLATRLAGLGLDVRTLAQVVARSETSTRLQPREGVVWDVAGHADEWVSPLLPDDLSVEPPPEPATLTPPMLEQGAVHVLAQIVATKSRWIGERVLVTPSAYSLVRHPTAVHLVAELHRG
jgi:ferredoxin